MYITYILFLSSSSVPPPPWSQRRGNFWTLLTLKKLQLGLSELTIKVSRVMKTATNACKKTFLCLTEIVECVWSRFMDETAQSSPMRGFVPTKLG